MHLSYFSGFFDADGSVGIYRQGKNFVIRCSIYNSNLEIVKKFQEQFGGGIYIAVNRPDKGWKTVYRLILTGTKAVAFLNQIVEFTVVKKERALLALELHNIKMNREYDKMEDTFDRMKILNKRGL